MNERQDAKNAKIGKKREFVSVSAAFLAFDLGVLGVLAFIFYILSGIRIFPVDVK